MSSKFQMILAVAGLALAGCSDGADGTNGSPGADGTVGVDGSDGVDGTNGNNGTIGTNGTDGDDGMDGISGVDATPPSPQCRLCHDSGSLFDIETAHRGLTGGKNLAVNITDVSNFSGQLQVTFTVADVEQSFPVQNITPGAVRILVNEFTPSPNAYDLSEWSKYHMREYTDDGTLTQNPAVPGEYTYTFVETIAATVAGGANAALAQQVSMRVRGHYDYNSAGDIYQMAALPTSPGSQPEVATPTTDIVATSACESCHGEGLPSIGHGYSKVETCRNCHTRDDASFLTQGLDLMTMVHQIHAAVDHTNGGVDPGEDWSEVTYPQDVNNCAKCHQGVDADLWNMKPNIEACGSCHNDVDFTTGVNHMGGGPWQNADCAMCHNNPADGSHLRAKHASENVTPFNPLLPVGLTNITYEINSVTADVAGVATVNFAILEDGTPMSGLVTTYPPAGFMDGPSFKLAYALPQDGIDEPADWNNRGETQGQPLSISLSAVQAAGDLAVGTDTDTYDAVLNGVAFPANATMRAVAIDGYFATDPADVARHAPSVVMAVDGDDERRAVINFNGCLDCHERLELHGGNRVIAAETAVDSVAVCLTCHNPNLSSSGNTFDYADFVANPTSYNSSSVATVATYGTDPFLWPEAAQNFKELVHGIHSADVRGTPYEHVRIRGGNAYSYDWSEVTFPGDPSDCAKCHVDDSYTLEEIPVEALMSTNVTGVPTNLTEALAVRDSVPNDDDDVSPAVVGACRGCHAGTVVDAHMNQFGAKLGKTRLQLLNP